MSAATTNFHLASFLSDPLFCELTSLNQGIGDCIACDLCKSTVINDRLAPDVMFHMLFGILKITHSLHAQVQKLTQLSPLNPPLLAANDLSDRLPVALIKEEVKENSVELPVAPQTISPARDWLAKLKRTSQGTAKTYEGQVLRFEKWLAGRPITQENVEDYIELRNSEGVSTKQVVAALKYRYVVFEKLPLSFSKLAEGSKNKNPHHPVTADQRNQIDQKLVKNLKMRLACRLLFDLAARSQDLVDLTFESFVEAPGGGANVAWKPRK